MLSVSVPLGVLRFSGVARFFFLRSVTIIATANANSGYETKKKKTNLSNFRLFGSLI